MSEYVFIYWDELPEKDYTELQDALQDKLLYGSINVDNTIKAKGYGDNNSNGCKEVF